jgi:hypothetical protein
MVAWQQQMLIQQQVAAAEGLPPASKKKHIGAHDLATTRREARGPHGV